MKVNPLTGGTSFGGRKARNKRRLNQIFGKKIGDRKLGTSRNSSSERQRAQLDAAHLFETNVVWNGNNYEVIARED